MNEQKKPAEMEIRELANQLRLGLDVQDRTYHLRTYPKCFVGQEAISWMVSNGLATDPEDAISIGNMMIAAGIFHHVTRDHPFKNDALFYRFTEDEPSSGEAAKLPDGSQVSWGNYIDGDLANADRNFQAKIRRLIPSEVEQMMALSDKLEVSPLDEHNAKLLDNVHPAQWVDPAPAPCYNMVVIGAGAGGLVTAAGSAGVGAKVALIEKNLLGGDCLNVGCVPSKALLKAAKVAHQVRTAHEYGVVIEGEIKIDFGAIMQRMRKLRAQISKNDSWQRFTAQLGIDVFIGEAKFTSKNTVMVNGKTLKFTKATIATGATASIPNVPGLNRIPYLTNATVFNLTKLPPRLAVIGAGPIGCELAQAFRRFGSEVTVFVRSNRILEKEEQEAAVIVKKSMLADGVKFMESTKLEKFEILQPADEIKGHPFPTIEITFEREAKIQQLEVDAVLIATGRTPNVRELGLEAAGVKYSTSAGVLVNDMLQSSVGHIYAVGDCATNYQFTHMADFMARLVIRNALFFGSGKVSSLIVPWATYTDPEVAHVGLYEEDLKERGIEYSVYSRDMADVDRAIVDGETEGYVKVLTKKGTDQILGATIVGSHAGDMISELTLAMNHKIGLGSIATVIHPYPTQAEAIRQCGDAYNRTRLTTIVKTLFRQIMAVQR